MKSIDDLLTDIDLGIEIIRSNKNLQHIKDISSQKLFDTLIGSDNLGQRFVCNMAGLSWSGKDTIHALVKDCIQDMKKDSPFISYHYHPRATTRAARPHEIHGVDYHFFDKDSFDNALRQQEIIAIEEFAGNYYGLIKPDFLLNGKSFHVIVAISGWLTQALQTYCKSHGLPFLDMFVIAPDADTLFSRLEARDKSTQTDWQAYATKRLQGVLDDICKYIEDPDAYGKYLFVNDDIDYTREYIRDFMMHVYKNYTSQLEFV